MDFVRNLENILKLSFKGDDVRETSDIKRIISSGAKSEDNEIVSDHIEKVLNSIELLLRIYQDNYETRFGFFIEHIFHQIKNLLESALCNAELSSLPLDRLFNILALIIEITVSHSIEANVLNLAQFYTCNLNDIKLKHSVECDSLSLVPEELTFRLSVISLMYETVCNMNKRQSNGCDTVKKLMGHMGTNNNECKLFSKLVNYNSDVVAAQTLISVIPKYIDFCGNSAILRFIWDELSESIINNDVEHSRMFIVLCYLSDLYFTADNKRLMTDIFKDRNYWSLLQKGLMNPDASVRKQALHLMKTSHHYIIQNDICFYCFKNVQNVREKMDNNEMLMGRESNSNQLDEYKELCVIIEYLEEKQVHIVKPIFNLIEKFIENNLYTQRLGVTWVMIVIQRMLSHDNMKIVRSGISILLKIPISFYNNEDVMMSAIKLLVSNINCTQLYLTDCSSTLDELKMYFEKCSNSAQGDMFFKLLTQAICSVQWSSEALFFMASALKSIKSKNYWQKDQLNLIKKLLMVGSANHYTYIKSGTQCQLLLSSINLIDTETVTLEDIFGFLSCFNRDMCLKRFTIVWGEVVSWLKRCYSPDDFKRIITDSIANRVGSRDVGRLIVMEWDVFGPDPRGTVLTQVSESFVDGWSRPYVDMEAMDFHLSVVCDVINEASYDMSLLKRLTPYLEHFILFIRRRLDMLSHIRDFELCQNVLKSLRTILKLDEEKLTFPAVRRWSEYIAKDMTSNAGDVPMQKFVKMKTLDTIMEHTPYWRTFPEVANLRSHLRKELNSPVSRTTADSTLTRDLQTMWGRLNSEYLQARWRILSKITKSHECLDIDSQEFIRLCLEGLDVAGHSVLEPMMTAVAKALPGLLREGQVGRLVDGVWKAVVERKKNDDFDELVRMFVEMVFQEGVVVAAEDQSFGGVLLDYSRKLLSETSVQVANIFLKQLGKWMNQAGTNGSHFNAAKFLLLDVLPRALLFGQVPRKDERLIGEVCAMIEAEGLSPLPNDWCTHSEVRARAVLLTSLMGRSDSFAGQLVEALIAAEERITENKSRYFADSHVHRVKLRLMQALLILHGYMEDGRSDEETYRKLWNWVSGKLIIENNQPSVRYMQQWLMFRYMRANPALMDEMQSCFDEGLDKRTGSLCSLISVAYLAERFAPGGGPRNLSRLLLPHCMAQHFSVRLYAQVALQCLMKQTRDDDPNTTELELIAKSLTRSIERGNYVKNFAKLRDDFFFAAFHPDEHLSMETIFFEIPRLTNVTADEWIPVHVFERCLPPGAAYPMKLRNESESLRSFESCKWLAEGGRQDDLAGEDHDGGGGENSELSNYQKKVVPVKCLLPDWEELVQSKSYSARKQTEKEGLIVVASLIDRIPNLGGLSRTCEVFGASELVISSLKYTEDKQFQSLSVTAEKWIPITEVKPFHLSEYLLNMKRMGYTIMAAEQTINSQPLQSVKFPKKSLLLLGNEKEGIPPPLLPLMDVCVEVPQAGVIRSLNVHVTGALFVWEYAKQHHFSR